MLSFAYLDDAQHNGSNFFPDVSVLITRGKSETMMKAQEMENLRTFPLSGRKWIGLGEGGEAGSLSSSVPHGC